MHQNIRAALSFIAISIINKEEYDSIFDFSRSVHVLISGEIANESVGVFDHELNAHISGDYQQGSGALYHHGFQCHLSFEWDDSEFRGFVHGGEGGHLTGQIQGDSISLFDHSNSTHYHFSVK